MKNLIWIGLFVGSTVGGSIPNLWGAPLFSLSSVFLSALGSIVGIWAAVKMGKALGM